MSFLKLYDGLPPVFSIDFRWSIYGFYWRHYKRNVKSERRSPLFYTAVGLL